jgi:hypothetical protein
MISEFNKQLWKKLSRTSRKPEQLEAVKKAWQNGLNKQNLMQRKPL